MLVTNKPRTFVKHRRQHEEGEQQKFVNWLQREFPQVIVYCDVIGEDLTDSGRMRAYKMRSRRGIPDVMIDYPSRGFHGARFEFKKAGAVIYNRDGSLRKQSYRYTKNGRIYSGDHLLEQATTLKELNARGYFARFALGLDHAKKLFYWYMDMEAQDNETLF